MEAKSDPGRGISIVGGYIPVNLKVLNCCYLSLLLALAVQNHTSNCNEVLSQYFVDLPVTGI